jgi:hypothetical protein
VSIAGEQMMYSTGTDGDDVLFTHHSSRTCHEAIIKATNFRLILVAKVLPAARTRRAHTRTAWCIAII